MQRTEHRFLPLIAPAAALALGLSAAGAVQAGETGNDGIWCHPEHGSALFWEERSLGLSEHTMCDWAEAPAGRATLNTKIHCAFIYLEEDGSARRINPVSHRFQATRLSAEKLQVQFNDEDPVVLTRCET
ncbi:MAG: hypothetical protein GY947_05925 [Rhodobacteraceae bacterium]|nr:hypothetical protein [Paracoccaceae bacterium]